MMLVKSYSVLPIVLQCIMKKDFVLAFFKVSVDHDLFDNLESGKRSSCFGKKSGKDLNFGSKICLNPPNRNPHF